MGFNRRSYRVLATLVFIVGQTAAWAAQPVARIHAAAGAGDTLYAVSAETEPAADTFGLFRSNDRGYTWARVGVFPTPEAASSAITSIGTSFDMDLNDYVFAGVEGHGIFRSVDGARTWQPWNDAAITVADIGSGLANDPVSAISDDGYLYASFDHGENWLVFAAFPGATSLHVDGRFTLVGNSFGHVVEVENPDGRYRFLTPDALGGPVSYVGRTRSQTYAVVEHTDGSGARLHRGSGFDDREWAELLVEGNTLDVSAFAATSGFLFVVNEGANRDFLVRDVDAGTWFTASLPVAGAINHIEAKSCLSAGCIPTVFIATDEGGFRSVDGGQTWIQLGDLVVPPLPEVVVVASDLGVEMVSPAPTSATITNSTSRFELSVTNHGPARVQDVSVGLDFVTWRDGSTQGSSSYGTSVTVNGVECSRDVDWILFAYKTVQCDIEALEPGESARIVWIHGLPADAFSMRLEAEVASYLVSDPHPNNDRLDFSPSVRTPAEIAQNASGGGGAFGPGWLLLLAALRLLALGRFQSRNR